MRLVFLAPVLASIVFLPSSAAVDVGPGGPEYLRARIRLADGTAGGAISIEDLRSGPPLALTLEWVEGQRGSRNDLELFLNDDRFAIERADVLAGPRPRTFRIDDADRIARAWREDAPNVVRLTSRGLGSGIAWARVRVGSGLGSPTTCLVDVGGGGCEGERPGLTGVVRGEFEISATLPSGGGTVPRLRLPFPGAKLPATVDMGALSDGPHVLCVESRGVADCAAFQRRGELVIQIETPPETHAPPVADAGAGGPTECTSQDGATVQLDGSASTGEITSYEWLEDYGTSLERMLGTGPRLAVTLPVGPHAVTLRVTDTAGQSALAQVAHAVVDTTPPVVRVATTPTSVWPPDHRMVAVSATPIVVEACSPVTTLVLGWIASNEADDLPGDADGNTQGDIQGASIGTDDRAFSIRAETGTIFGGRRYTMTYSAIDASGNTGLGTGAVSVKAMRKPAVVEP